MHILVVTQYFWPENFRINDLVREWTGNGHRVTVLTGKPNYPSGKIFPEFARDPGRYQEYEGATVLRVPMLPRGTGSLRLMMNYISFVLGAFLVAPWKLRRCDPDVIFVFEPSPVTVGLPAIFLGRLKKRPVVFWALDLWPETLLAVGTLRSPKAISAVARLVRFIYNNCTLVLGQSRAFLPSIAKYCDDPQKVRYFPTWAEDVFAQQNVAPAPEVPDAPGTFNILFAGNVGEAQDFPSILDAAERLKNKPQFRWLIVGDGRKSEWLAEQVASRGLQERVLLLGRFPLERMPSFYLRSDVLLVSLKPDPVFSMTIPGKVQSYLVTGKPIVGMIDGEGAEVIRLSGAGLVASAGDGEALAKQLQHLAGLSPEERRQMGENGKKYAQAEFNRDVLMTRLMELLKEAQMLYGKSSR